MDMTQKPSKNRQVGIKTPQSLIHIKHRISLLQYKYWITLLYDLKEQIDHGEQPDEKGFRYISLEKIADMVGYTPKKSEIWADLKAIKNETISFNVLDKDGEKAKYGAGFISEWKVSTKRVGYVFPSVLVDAMKGVDTAKNIFQLLNWDVFNSFSGKYEAIIYKLCKDYIGVKRTPYMTIFEYRDYIGLKENEYLSMDDFNKRCVKNPIKSINENEISDIEVSVEFIRKGRKIEGLYFIVSEKRQNSIPFFELEPNPAFMFAKVSISIPEQMKYLETMPPEEIEATIKRANEYGEDLKAQGKKVQMGAIYHKAFSERWGVQYLEQAKTEQTEAQKKQAIAEQKRAEEKQRIEAEKSEKQASEKLIAKFEALTENEKVSILEAFLETKKDLHIVGGSLLKIYKEQGIESHKSKVFKVNFLVFLRENNMFK